MPAGGQRFYLVRIALTPSQVRDAMREGRFQVEALQLGYANVRAHTEIDDAGEDMRPRGNVAAW